MSDGNSRAIAARVLDAVIAGKGSLTNLLASSVDHPEQGLIQESCFGVCRWYAQLDWLRRQLLQRPLRSKDSDLGALLLVGIYQLRELSLPAYAVINESVNATAALNKPWARGLVNGVLRNFQRRQEPLNTLLEEAAEPIRYAFPDWLLLQLQADWPSCWSLLAENSNRRPPMTLRVNLGRGSREAYLAGLADAGISAQPGALAPTAVYLERPQPVSALPGFADGLVSVQDEASQLVPGLLRPQAGQRLLDACAAPGGKTCHLLESEPSLAVVTAVDMEAARMERLQENLKRLHLQADARVADVADVAAWWDGEPFDRILLDAPCSATGVLRRHPDIKLLRRANDIPALAQTQLQLLESLWPCLAPGGKLLYTTCSLLREENEGTVAAFLARTQDAKYEHIAADWGVECRYGRQLLTSDYNGPDGFFYALLQKIPANPN
ncbi:MAG: 16S rRNA (cytosine(967)-C(5))-methyltransferase RsmB [Pseudohongiellaceae bacterium]